MPATAHWNYTGGYQEHPCSYPEQNHCAFFREVVLYDFIVSILVYDVGLRGLKPLCCCRCWMVQAEFVSPSTVPRLTSARPLSWLELEASISAERDSARGCQAVTRSSVSQTTHAQYPCHQVIDNHISQRVKLFKESWSKARYERSEH